MDDFDMRELTKSMSVVLGSVEQRYRGRVVRRDTYLESNSIVRTLYQIKDECDEPHTKRNIARLIDAIDDLSPTL